MSIHFLSPRIVTRTRVSPEQLSDSVFRVANSRVPCQHLARALDIARASRPGEARTVSRYDFRLCISAGAETACFSSDAKAALSRAGAFGLPASDQAAVLAIFKALDPQLP